jgi:hypothetical protein
MATSETGGRRVHLFVGPTLRPAEVRATVPPDWSIHPPVRHGDLFLLDPGPQDVIAIVDGLFYQAPPIRHQEILVALRRGATVYGASSMGALRAAELHSCGMRGVGTVFLMYRDGVIDADDEVAIVHSDADGDWRPLSDALVNLRAGLARATAIGLLTEAERAALVTRAATLPFTERRLPELLVRAVRDQLIGEPRRTELARTLPAAQVDLKAGDARELIRLLAAGPAEATVPAVRKPPTAYELIWRDQTVPAEAAGGQPLSRNAVLTAAQVLATDYPAFHERSMLLLAAAMVDPGFRAIDAADLMDMGERDASDRVLDAAREVLGTADLTTVAPDRLWRAASTLAADSGWLGPSGPDPVRHRSWLTQHEWTTLPEDHRVARIVARSLHWAPGLLPRPFLLARLRAAGALDRMVAAAAEAQRFNEELAIRDDRYQLAHLSHPRMMRWFLARWGGAREPFPVAAARGFTSKDTLAEAITPFYPIVRLTERFAALEVSAR